MAQITMTIHDILNMYAWENDQDITKRNELIVYGTPRLFDFEYEFYDEALRDRFEYEFILNFYMSEIAFDSVALFKLHLERYLLINMDKWKRLYNSLTDDINPFYTIDIKTDRHIDEKELNDNKKNRDEIRKNDFESNQVTGEKTSGQADKTEHSDTTGFQRSLNATVPDSRLDIAENNIIQYADGVEETTDKGTADGKSKNTFTNDMKNERDATGKENSNLERADVELKDRDYDHDFKERKVGKDGSDSYTKMQAEYVRHFNTINNMMFKEMKRLFMAFL